MDCCELARLALWVIGGAFGVILLLFVMFFGYGLTLDKRTVKLEKKNGHEQSQLAEQLEEIEKLKKEQKELKYYVLSILPKEKNPS